MDATGTILCNSCKTEPATTFIQGTLEIVGRERYRVKCLNLALCDACAELVDQVTETGARLAEVLVGGGQ